MVDTACQTTPFEASKQTAEILHKVQVRINFIRFKRT